MTTVTLPTRVRRTHLGCRIEERVASKGGHLHHFIHLSCPRPYIEHDVRKLELADQNAGKRWPG
jgi:hypothetical protein